MNARARTLRSVPIAAALGAVALVATITAARASTFVELTFSDLVSRSTTVVAGTPVERRSVWESTGGARTQRIVTYTRVRVDRVVDGQAGAEVWVRTLGGQVDGIGQRVEGEAILTPSRPALLFLTARADGTHGVAGMAQGHYPLQTAAAGTPAVLAYPTGLGRLVDDKTALAAGAQRMARLVLPGRDLDDVAKLIATERAAHAR